MELIFLAKEKLSNDQKKGIAVLNPSGKMIDALSKITKTSKSTVYKAKREGNLLNQIDEIEKSNRELTVQNQFLKMTLSSKKGKKSSGHS